MILADILSILLRVGELIFAAVVAGITGMCCFSVGGAEGAYGSGQ